MQGCTKWLFFSVLALGVAGCGEVFSGTQAAVRVGAVYPLSGPQSNVGEEVKQGIDLAIEIVNGEYELALPLAKERGLPELGAAPVEVVYADHESTEALVRERTEQLVRQDEVVALIGAYESASTRVASEMAEQAGVPFVTATSTSAALTERGFQWFFRITPTDETFVINGFEFITEVSALHDGGLERVAVIREPTDLGTGFMELVEAWAPQYGMDVVAEIVTQGVGESVADQVAQVRAAEPQVVLIAVYADDAIRFMQEFKAQNYAPPMIWADDAGFISQEFRQTLGADAAYVTSREVWSLDLAQTNELAAQINALYRERYGTDMNGNSVRGFIGMMTLAEAINRAASTDPVAVRDALRATDIPAEQLITAWDGVRFDDTGQNALGNGIVVQMLNGRYTAVWPADIAVEPVVFPFPEWGAR